MSNVILQLNLTLYEDLQIRRSLAPESAALPSSAAELLICSFFFLQQSFTVLKLFSAKYHN